MRRKPGTQKVEQAKENLASTFVNAFVNMGFGKDTLVTPEGCLLLLRCSTTSGRLRLDLQE